MFGDVYGECWREGKLGSNLVALGFLESPDLSPHYHVVARLDDAVAHWLEKYGAREWKKMSNRGQLYSEEINDQRRVRKYCTKRIVDTKAFDDIFVY